MATHCFSSRSTRRTGVPLVAMMFVVAVSALGCGGQTAPSATSRASPVSPVATAASGAPTAAPDGPPLLPSTDDEPASSDPFDVSDPAIGNLEPRLLEAIQAAASDALDDGVRIAVTSGWRSRDHQQRLFDEAVATYGSEEEALRFVATPDTSAHVTGDALDIGPTDADSWLSQHGADYGLCQTFANEIWHFELATDPGGQCPAMFPDGSSRS